MRSVNKRTPLKKAQAGGRSISEKAAKRKTSKGKGTISYRYGDKDAPGEGANKGSYIGLSKESRKSSSPFVSMKDAKPAREIKQQGGTSPKKSPKPKDPAKGPRINMITPDNKPRKKPDSLIPEAPRKPLIARRGGVANKYQKGGKTISEKAATRKTSKGKGFISSTMGPNPSGDKGAYIPFTKQGNRDAKKTGVVSNKEMKSSRKILQKGGAKRTPLKKAQAGKSIKTDTTPKIIRWEGGNTGKKAPAYMLDSTGNPKPQYAKALKEKHKLRLGGSTQKKKK